MFQHLHKSEYPISNPKGGPYQLTGGKSKMIIRLIIGAVIGGAIGLVISLVSTRITSGSEFK